MNQNAFALQPSTDQGSAGWQALSAALDAASAYARIAAMTDIAETAQHNYRNAQRAHEIAQEAVSKTAAVPAYFLTQLSDIEAQLEVLESQLA